MKYLTTPPAEDPALDRKLSGSAKVLHAVLLSSLRPLTVALAEEIPFDVVPRLPQEEAARGRLPIHQPTAAPSTAPKVAAPPAPLQDHEIPPAGEFTGAHLLRWRRGLKLSQRPAAQRLGISQGWLSKTEKALTERVGPKLQDALERELGPHRQQHSAAEGPNQPHELPTQ